MLKLIEYCKVFERLTRDGLIVILPSYWGATGKELIVLIDRFVIKKVANTTERILIIHDQTLENLDSIYY